MAFKSDRLPLLSILVPLRDNADAVKRALESCLAQRYPNVETIIVDNGAAAGSAEIAHSYGPRVRIVQIPQKVSMCVARNIGLSHALGEFVLFHERDDVLFPDRFWCDIELAMQPHTDIVISLDRLVREGETLSLNPEPICRRERRLLRSTMSISGVPAQGILSLLQHGSPRHSCVLYRTSIVRALAGYADVTEPCEEQDLLFRALCRGATAVLNPRVTSAHQLGDETESDSSTHSIHESMKRLELARRYATALTEAGLLREEFLRQALINFTVERVYEYAKQRQHLETAAAALNLIASLRNGDQINSVFDVRTPSVDSCLPSETTRT
jgi:hypothetical protein